MAEEKKQSKEYNLAGDSFKLSSRIVSQGYNSIIDGRKFKIDYAKDFRGNQISQYASLCVLQETPNGKEWLPMNPPVYEVTGLTKTQFRELATAQVLALTEAQELEFIKMFHPKLYKFEVKKRSKTEDE